MPNRIVVLSLVVPLVLAACQTPPPSPREPSTGHIAESTPAPAPAAIPSTVKRTPFIPVPDARPPQETYTVVVNEVPVKELLFALARDASLNVDVHPDVGGLVTLNAIDQTLEQILDRISRQVDVRYQHKGDTLLIGPDAPYLRVYKVDYVNISRNTTTGVGLSTQIETQGDGGGSISNTSTTTVAGESNHRFWESITNTIRAMIIGDPKRALGSDGEVQTLEPEEIVIPNPESGVLVVRATSGQHEQIQKYLDQVLGNIKRQVLIEATVVEVELSDKYQAGIDWQKFVATGAGIGLQQSFLGGGAAALGAAPFFALTYSDAVGGSTATTTQDINLSVRLLKEFGNTTVLSSPKLMVLNNHTATLKAVDNRVFFDVDTEVVQSTVVGVAPTISIDTEVRTVPEGFVMAITPQIGDGDEVTVNVRPTITRVLGTVNDPAIQPSAGNPTPLNNAIPQIRVREMESMLRVNSGQVAVLGGLMQDNNSENTDAVPVLSEVEEFGEAFKTRNNNFIKTELVIFLRPWVIRTPSVEADLKQFQRFLPENLKPAKPIPPAKKVF